MFGMEYVLAFMAMCMTVATNIVYAIPFYYSWNCVAPVYFKFIPELYHELPYWHVVAFFLVVDILGKQIPKLINITQNNGNK